MVVLKNGRPVISSLQVDLFNICLNEFYFPDFWQVLSEVPVFKNVGEKSVAKITNL